jgi:acetate kinase
VRVLVVNAGSSSLKLALLDGDDETIASRELEAPGMSIDQAELHAALADGFGGAEAVGHRVVHGGERFDGPALVDDAVTAALHELVDLAPLHQPKALAALAAVTRELPGLPSVACFDTAFHATLSKAAATYALPASWRERWGLRRYGFHGLSHAWVARRVPELLGVSSSELRIVSCHLGAGASLCAIRDGRSIDTTMGFTPLEGLVMATRSGDVDPGLLLWLLEGGGLSARELAEGLEHEAGLKGLSGSADMRDVLYAAAGGAQDAQLALDVYVHRLRAGVASMAAALGGLDVIAFTGGIGERSAPVRSLAVGGLGFLGAALDEQRNGGATPDADLSAAGAAVRTVVIAAREDLEIARQTRMVLGAPAAR